MKLTKNQIIGLIITGIIVIDNLVYFQISKLDEPIFIKKYSELFYDNNINLEFIKGIDNKEYNDMDFFNNSNTRGMINITFPEIDKSYNMILNSWNEFRSKYEYLKYMLEVNEYAEGEDLYDYINKNGPVRLTKAIINTYEGETYNVDLGEIILNPSDINANRLVDVRGYSGNADEDSMVWISNEPICINKIESRYLEELKNYYDFSLLINNEKISINEIQYPLSVRGNSEFKFVFAKKKEKDIDIKSIYDTEIKIEIEDKDKKKENLYVRVRNISEHDIISERNILSLKH